MNKLPTVAGIMATRLHTLAPDDDIVFAMELFLKHKISGAPVVDQGNLVGVLSEKDCMQLLLSSYFDPNSLGQVAEFMTRDPMTITSQTAVEKVAHIFLENPYRRLPVVDDGALVGQVSRRDVLAAIHDVVKRGSEKRTDPRDRGSMITESDKPDPVGPLANVKWAK